MKLPQLLGDGMKVRARLHPSALALTVKLEPPSTGSITLNDNLGIKERDFIRVFLPNGESGIYKVVGTNDDVFTKIRFPIEHSITTLSDGIAKGDGKYSGTLRQVVESFMNHQTAPKHWKLGTVPDVNGVEVEYNGTNVLEGIMAALKQAGGVMMTFDQSRYPWTFNIVKLSSEIKAEGRFSRNLNSIAIDTDDMQRVTRLYWDDGKKSKDADTIAKDGVIIEKQITIPENATPESTEKYVNDYLEKHKNPNVSITLDAFDLFSATNDRIDKFCIGDMFRCCIPERHRTVKNRVVSIAYNDLLGKEKNPTITLSDTAKETSDFLLELTDRTHQLAETSRRHGRRIGGIGGRVDKAEQEILLRVTDEQLKVVDERLTKQLNEAYVSINAQGVSIGAVETQQTLFGEELSRAQATLTVQAKEIELKVSKGDVISSINTSAEKIVISSSKINLDAAITSIENSFSEQITTKELAVNTNFRFAAKKCEWTQLQICTSIPAFHTTVIKDSAGVRKTVVTGWKDNSSPNYVRKFVMTGGDW